MTLPLPLYYIITTNSILKNSNYCTTISYPVLCTVYYGMPRYWHYWQPCPGNLGCPHKIQGTKVRKLQFKQCKALCSVLTTFLYSVQYSVVYRIYFSKFPGCWQLVTTWPPPLLAEMELTYIFPFKKPVNTTFRNLALSTWRIW